jgi:hypothetical protein
MSRPASRKRILHVPLLPDELLHTIFSKLDFRDKVIAGQVCKHWDQLLKAGTVAARHWVVEYNFESILDSRELETTKKGPTTPQEQLTSLQRCVTALKSFLIARSAMTPVNAEMTCAHCMACISVP